MELGRPSRFELLPLDELSQEELDKLALAVKARCLAELPSAMAAKMASQRQEEKRLYKEETERSDEKHKALTRLVRYAGPDIAQKAESLEEVKIIASEGGQPPNIGVLNYVSDLIKRAEGPPDPLEIAEGVLKVFPDRYRSEEYRDYPEAVRTPEAVRALGQQLIQRALEHQEKVRSIDEAITKAMQEEKTAAHYIKGDIRPRFRKTIPLYEAVKRIGAGSLLEWYESGLKK